MSAKKKDTDEVKAEKPKTKKVTAAAAIDPAKNPKFRLAGATANIAEAISRTQSALKKNKTYLTATGDRTELTLHLRHLALQFLFDCREIPAARVIEIIGPTGKGKTTLAIMLAGMFYEQDANPALPIWMETENKPMNIDHIRRCLSENAELADHLLDDKVFGRLDPRSSQEIDDQVQSVITNARGAAGAKGGKQIPDNSPIVFIVDTLSKLLSAAEAVGVVDYDDNLNPKKLKDQKSITERNQMVFAAEMAAWFRKIPALQKQYNMMLILLSHKNTKVEMGGRPSYLPASYTEKFNTTKRGGKSVDQNSAFQLVMTEAGRAMSVDTNEQTGDLVNIRMNKNSHGQPGREIVLELRNVNQALQLTDDLENNYRTSPWRFDECLAKMLAERELCGIKSEGGAYTCKELGLRAVDARRLCAAIHGNADFAARVGQGLGITGYGQAAFIPANPEATGDSEPEEGDEAA